MAILRGWNGEPYEGLDDAESLRRFVEQCPFGAAGQRRKTAATIDVPTRLEVEIAPSMSTQQGFGLLMHGDRQA